MARFVLCLLSVASAFSVASTSAWAQPRPARPWMVSATTSVPLAFGGQLAVRSGPWRASGSLGILPGAYVDLINAAAVANGSYDQDTADLIRNTLSRSAVLELTGGVSLFGTGFFVDAGYAAVVFGGGVTAGSSLAVALEIDTDLIELPAGLGETVLFEVDSTLHLARAEAGYEFWAGPGWVIRAAIGVATTFASSTTVEGRSTARLLSGTPFTTEAARRLDEIYQENVHTPLLSLALGRRF
jgi:hypothetical protein